MKTLLIGMIRLYQIILAPLTGGCCRFDPSCSSYCIQAIRTHGCLKGLLLGMSRICRCHPFHPGGWDPVPEAKY